MKLEKVAMVQKKLLCKSARQVHSGMSVPTQPVLKSLSLLEKPNPYINKT
jgi:hypothetical protein